MDFPSRDELFANQFDGDIQAMGEWLGVDSLGYTSVPGLADAVKSSSGSPHGFCDACFSCRYPVPTEEGVTKEENDW
jgi:glutamine phosphoribosylpyrophosphate amidotransferase